MLQSMGSQGVRHESCLPMKETQDAGPVPGSGRSPGVGHGNPLQYSCLENSIDRGAWQLQSTWPQRVGHDYACPVLFGSHDKGILMEKAVADTLFLCHFSPMSPKPCPAVLDFTVSEVIAGAYRVPIR